MIEKTSVKLTGAELGTLWYHFMSDSMLYYVTKFWISIVEDTEIKQVLQTANRLSKNHLTQIEFFLEGEEFPKPTGFTDEDLNMNAPRLFFDPFYLTYIRNMTRIAVQRYGLALTTMARADIRAFYQQCLTESASLSQSSTDIEQTKGLYVRSPYIPIPDKVEFISSSKFMGSLFGEKRPLLGVEVDHLFVNAQSNAIGKTLITAFSQVAESDDVRDYFLEGKEIAQKHIQAFSSILTNNDLPTPTSLDSYITASTVPPFSDKLMLAHIMMLNATGLGNYGVSMSVSMRTDLIAKYARLMAEIGTYIEDGVQLSIAKGWLEEPPHAANRKELALTH